MDRKYALVLAVFVWIVSPYREAHIEVNQDVIPPAAGCHPTMPASAVTPCRWPRNVVNPSPCTPVSHHPAVAVGRLIAGMWSRVAILNFYYNISSFEALLKLLIFKINGLATRPSLV